MNKNRVYLGLMLLIFFLALGIRLYVAFKTPYFELEEAYFSYRQVESIKTTGLPTYFDELSYSGRVRIFPPFYYYFLSFFSFLFGTALTLKLVPNILASSIVIILYFIAAHITNNKKIALFSSFTSAFVPIFFTKTINSASIVTFTIPLIFYLLYCLMRIKEKKFSYQFLLLSFILSITSAISFLFILILLLYLLLIKLEFKTQNRIELESVFFVTFLTLWINIIMYKKAFLFHSYALIWQNIPTQILDNYFKQVDLFASIASVGFIPLLLGIYAIYKYMFKEREKQTYLLMAFALVVALLLWLKLITLNLGLMFSGFILIPLLGQTLNLFFKYLEKTKISTYKNLFWAGLFLLVVFTSALPAVIRATSEENVVSPQEIEALNWLKENTPEESVILSTISEGNLISAVAERKNVADNDFLLIRLSGERFDDVERMYKAAFKTQAVELMSKYDVDYIYFSPRAKERFEIENLKYVEKDCFEQVYDSEIKIYKLLCEIRDR
jgi:4-amino-4-deoxy-L-arabinose transferase-like glycosyltransferase